ncbi:MAG: type II toxin-antitoxin system HicA family toxin [Candidatus Verstraetearchaeota archaeon]|nr:type II toxin-antitoxin system HicA family toxin [Candidatus Verstraetearchaeota archaeon]
MRAHLSSPTLSWRDIVKVLVKAGFQLVRQKPSYLAKNEYVIPVPKRKEIKRSLLLEIIAGRI